MTIDAWMQHPTGGSPGHEIFAPLLRWTGQEAPEEETRGLFLTGNARRVFLLD